MTHKFIFASEYTVALALAVLATGLFASGADAGLDDDAPFRSDGKTRNAADPIYFGGKLADFVMNAEAETGLRVSPPTGTELFAGQRFDLRIETQSAHGRAHAAEADISVVVGTGPWNGLVAHKMFAQTMVPACSPELLAEKPVLRYEDLNAHTLLVHEARRDDWDRWATAVGMKTLNPSQIVRIDSMSAATRAAEKSIGIALLPAELSRRKFASGRLKRVFDDELVTQEDYTLLVRTEDENRDDIRALCAWLIESCRTVEEN